MSTNWLLDADPAPAILVLPPDAESLDEAHAAIELWEHYSHKTLDPSQRLVVEVMMAQRADGRWAAQTTGREMPRQNGKGDEFEVVEVWGLVQRAEAILHTIHDAVLLASQTQQRMLGVLEGHADLRRKIGKVWRGTGQQMIEMRNGGCIWYRTRTGGGGRGLDYVDRVVIDEAQHASHEHIDACTPPMGANPNPQLNVAGTAGIDGKSAWWWEQRIRALCDDPGEFGYVGHTAESVRLEDGKVIQDLVDVNDRDLWRSTNPSVIAGRGQGMTFLEEQLRRLGEGGFAREHLCVWDPPPDADALDAKLPLEAWRATRKSSSPAMAKGRLTIAYDVELDGGAASIAVGLGSLSKPYVEVIEHKREVGWLPARLVELVERWDPIKVGCNGAGPAGAQVGPILVAFRDAGIPSDLLDQLAGREYQQACGGFYSDVVEGRLSRPFDQQPLDAAGEDAAERPLAEAWVWARRQATVPISPLVASTIARALLPTEAKVDAAANVW